MGGFAHVWVDLHVLQEQVFKDNRVMETGRGGRSRTRNFKGFSVLWPSKVSNKLS